MKTLIESLLPRPIYELLRQRRREYLEQQYFKQDFTQIKCGAYDIEAPKNHLLAKLPSSQPYRDLCTGISAKYISAKYPDGTIIDIGANIGDTAAIIATYAQNKLILVEASDYFYEILLRNTSKLPNEIIIKKVFLSDGSQVAGSFFHRGGTASFDERTEGKVQINTERLSSIADENICFVKTDTDGYDFKILLDSVEWLASAHPAIIFENTIGNNQELNSANELYTRLIEIGYAYFIVWDDRGFHLVSTTSLDVLMDLTRYLFKIRENDGKDIKSIYNYDVLCLHQNDKDVYKSICEWYKTY
ncbi:MAG: FkbM family methyltransferase [Nostoc sp. NMS1]|uniref:FkbM family methyltransferase n=1 Tax=unclassified Nostoc TaxID=2593658 RepID=UPI0025FF9816|nr:MULTISPECIES: FkbM family methyltransferase [unclassified Nostoc]MBN3908367.1 FkbM family methyltransferase [Nostoc sp. NMS1]MBN3992686.1 FkbM family methyltransferase [Nostoc sp. NMS2]